MKAGQRIMLIYRNRGDTFEGKRVLVRTSEHSAKPVQFDPSIGPKRRRYAIEHPHHEGRGKVLMRGLWHGDRDPRNPKNFGKVEGQRGIPVGKVTGNRLSPFLLRKMGN